MELFLDNDIILKFSAADLLEKIEKTYNADKDCIFVLPTAPFYFKNKTRLKKVYNENTVHRAIEATERYSVIPDKYINKEKFLGLADIEKIDSGEQVLFSVTPETKEFLILTGDKKSVGALNKAGNVDEIKTYLKNKIVFPEELMLRLIEDVGFGEIYKVVASSGFCFDKVLKTCFGQTNTDEKKVTDCLMSYIKAQKQSCPNLFS